MFVIKNPAFNKLYTNSKTERFIAITSDDKKFKQLDAYNSVHEILFQISREPACGIVYFVSKNANNFELGKATMKQLLDIAVDIELPITEVRIFCNGVPWSMLRTESTGGGLPKINFAW